MSEVQVEKKVTMFALEQDAAALEQLIMENNGEITDQLDAWLLEVENNIAEKADSYVAVMERFEVSEAYFESKAAQYKTVARQLSSTRTRLKDRIKEVMLRRGNLLIEGVRNVFKLQKSAPSLQIDETKLPLDYFKSEVVTTPDKERIRQELKEGRVVPGAHFAEGFSLRITLNKGKLK